MLEAENLNLNECKQFSHDNNKLLQFEKKKCTGATNGFG